MQLNKPVRFFNLLFERIYKVSVFLFKGCKIVVDLLFIISSLNGGFKSELKLAFLRFKGVSLYFI